MKRFLLTAALAFAPALALASSPGGQGDAQWGAAKAAFPVNTLVHCQMTVDTTVGGTEVKCSSAMTNPRKRIFKNCGSAAIFRGNTGVTTATGYKWDVGEALELAPSFDNQTGNLTVFKLYAITSSGSQTICIEEWQ